MLIYRILNKIKQFNLRMLKSKSNSIISRKATLSNETKIGLNVYLGAGSFNKTVIDDYSYVASGFLDNVKIGKFCSIGNNVNVVPYTHPIKHVSTSPAFISNSLCLMPGSGKFAKLRCLEEIRLNNGFYVEIGNDVWISNNVNIKGGVTIGDGAVIGMNSVVLKNVPPYSIVAGVPAKVIKFRFDKKTINQLLKIQWWNFDIDVIKKYGSLFDSPDKFIKKINEDKINF